MICMWNTELQNGKERKVVCLDSFIYLSLLSISCLHIHCIIQKWGTISHALDSRQLTCQWLDKTLIRPLPNMQKKVKTIFAVLGMYQNTLVVCHHMQNCIQKTNRQTEKKQTNKQTNKKATATTTTTTNCKQ